MAASDTQASSAAHGGSGAASAGRTPPKPERWLLVLTAALVAFFLVTLHPMTGLFGGVAFLLTAWAIPTLVNILVAAWVAYQFKLTRLARFGVFTAASLLLGLNTAIVRLPDALLTHSPTTSEVVRPVSITNSSLTYFRMHPSQPFAFANPLKPKVDVGGDEGCTCMYFVANASNSYGSSVAADLVAATATPIS